MPTPPAYKFYFRKNETTYYYVQDDTVLETTVKTPLRSLPKEWDKTEVLFDRHEYYLAVLRTNTKQYTYVGDALLIIRHVLYSQGAEGILYQDIEQLRDSDYLYEPFISGRMNLSIASDKDRSIVASMVDDSRINTLRTKGKSKIEIPCHADSEERVSLDGINLYGTYNYVPEDSSGGVTTEGTFIPNLYSTAPLIYISQEGDFPVAGTGSQLQSQSFDLIGWDTIGDIWSEDMFNSPVGMLIPNDALKVKLKTYWPARIFSSVSGAVSRYVDFDMFVVDATRKLVSITPVYTSPSIPPLTSPVTVEFFIEGETPRVPVTPGSKVYFVGRTRNAGSLTMVTIFFFANPTSVGTLDPAYYINLEVEFKLQRTSTAAIRYCDFFDRILKATFESPVNVSYSNFLRSTASYEDNVPYYTRVTPGDAIRGFSQAKIKTSADDTIQDAMARWQLGIGLNSAGQIILEPLSVFFDKDNMIADLGYVKDLVFTPMNPFLFNEALVGQNDQTYDSLNGRDEYNQRTNYLMPLKSVDNKLDLTSTFRWDMYGIETYRANLTKKITVDSGSDNDTFILSTAPDVPGTEKLRRPGPGGFVTGAKDPANSYNLDLTNMRTMRRNFKRLATCCYMRDGSSVTFGSTSKNSELSSRFSASAPIVTEKESIPVSVMGTPLFLPWWADFASQVPINLPKLLADNPNGYFRIRDRRGSFKVFLWKSRVVPSRNSAYEWRTVLCPDNDITLLKKS